MIAMRRRLPGWILWVATPLVAGLAALLAFKVIEAVRWKLLKQELEELSAEANARISIRPVLRGRALEGNAWEDYGPALRAVHDAGDLKPTWQYLYSTPPGSREQAMQAVNAHLRELDLLRRGASRAAVQVIGRGRDDLVSTDGQLLGHLAVCGSRLLWDGERKDAALELLLDTAQYGQDLMRNGTLIDALNGAAVEWGALKELKSHVNSRALGPEQMRELARQVEVLDDSFPSIGDAHLNHAIAMGTELVRQNGLRDKFKRFYLEQPTATARYGFSERTMIISAVRTELAAMSRGKEISDLPWSEYSAHQAERFAGADGPNPILKRLSGIGTSASQPREPFRERRTQLRRKRSVICTTHSGPPINPHRRMAEIFRRKPRAAVLL
jgi:hypothetical protein